MQLREISIEEASLPRLLTFLLEIRGNFKWDEFKALEQETLNDLDTEAATLRIKYANDNLEFLGSGSGRIVFLLSSKKVLKIANPFTSYQRGLAQNEAEVNIFTDPKIKPIVTKIYDFADDYSWIVSELVRPLQSEEEFEKLTNIRLEDFEFVIRDIEYLRRNRSVRSVEDAIKKIKEHPVPSIFNRLGNKNRFKSLESVLKNNKFVNYIIDLIFSNDLLRGDVIKLAHWGKTSDGRIVFLDYGFTEDVRNKYY